MILAVVAALAWLGLFMIAENPVQLISATAMVAAVWYFFARNKR